MRTAILSALLALAPAFGVASGEPQPDRALEAGQQSQQPPPNTTPGRDPSEKQEKSDKDKTEKVIPQPPMPPKTGETPDGAQGTPKPETGASPVPADPKTPGAPGNENAPANENKMPAAAPVDAKSYVIGPEDVIGVHVWDNAQLSGSFSVRPDGKISMPLIGEVQANGKTPEQLKTEITNGLKDGFVVSPNVNVSVIQVNSRKYYITGEINKPGPVALIVPTRILEAISNAGGFRDFANQKDIIILRGNQRLHFNYKDAIKGKHPEQNIYLEPGDYIIVR
jgi:polysaccharide export outer membrane protein